MTKATAELSLTYAAFCQLWDKLVSRRKARKHKLDKDTLWEHWAGNNGMVIEFDEVGVTRSRPAVKKDKRQDSENEETATMKALTQVPPLSKRATKRAPKGSAGKKD